MRRAERPYRPKRLIRAPTGCNRPVGLRPSGAPRMTVRGPDSVATDCVRLDDCDLRVVRHHGAVATRKKVGQAQRHDRTF